MAPKIGSLLTLKESPSVFLQVLKETKPQRPPLTELTRYLKVLVNQMFLHQPCSMKCKHPTKNLFFVEAIVNQASRLPAE